MKRVFLLFAFLLGSALPAAAQFDLVTGQVKDPNGIPYAGATVRAQLTINGVNVTGQPVVTNSNQAQCISAGLGNAPCQMPFPGTNSFTLDAQGNIPGGGFNLADNPSVTPAGTQWTFIVTISPGIAPPAGTGPQSFSISITVNANPLAIGGTLSAAAPALSSFSTAVTAKNSGLAGNADIWPNAPPYNITFDGRGCYGGNAVWANASHTMNCYTGTLISAGQVVINGTGGITVTFNSEQFNPIALGYQVGDTPTFTQFSGGDAFLNTTTLSITSLTANSITGTYVHTSYTNVGTGWIYNTALGPFATAQGFSRSASVISGPFANAPALGRTVVSEGTNCDAGSMNCVSAGHKAIMPVGTTTFVNATTISTTATSTPACNTIECQIQWLTDDRLVWYNPASPAGTVDNAVAGAAGCIALHVLGGTTPLPFGFGNTASPYCGSVAIIGSGEIQETDAGNKVVGAGIGVAKFLYLDNNNYSNCTGSTELGAIGCNFAGFSDASDFTIFGADDNDTGNHGVIYFAPNTQANFIDSISLTAFGAFDAGSYGFAIPFSNTNDKIYVDRFGGKVACLMAGSNNIILTNSFCGDINGVPVSMQPVGTTTIRTMNLYVGATNGTIAVWVGNGGSAAAWSSVNDQNYGSCGAGGAQIYVDNATASANLINWYGGNCAFDLEMNHGKVWAQHSRFTGSTNGINFLNPDAVFMDGGFNSVSSITGTGQYLGEANSANQVAFTITAAVLSAGWGSTAANTLPNGGDFPVTFTITNSGTGQAASPTITYTFPSPLPRAPISCTALQLGGTNPAGTFTTSALSATGATFTFSLTPTAGDTENMEIKCDTY